MPAAGALAGDRRLMHQEYGDDMVALLQLIWGEGFMTPGGADYIRTTLAGRDLSGKRVLDIGSGLGGHDIALARDYGAEVTGIEIEPDLLARARKLAARENLSDRIRFELVSPGPLPFADESFDAARCQEIPYPSRASAVIRRGTERGDEYAGALPLRRGVRIRGIAQPLERLGEPGLAERFDLDGRIGSKRRGSRPGLCLNAVIAEQRER